MEFISASAFQKYEDIINDINKEHEKSLQLTEELKQENNNIVIHNVLKAESLGKLSNVSVKIFSDIIELFTLYAGDLRENIFEYTKYENSKFYFIEIYITEELLNKLYKDNWMINISVRTDNLYVSKSVNSITQTIFEIIPVPEYIIDCIVEGYLINISNQWMSVKLDTVNIDISYHFHKYKRKQKYNHIDNILQLNRLHKRYLDGMPLKEAPPLLYQLSLLELDKHKFMETLIKHSYHSLDIELFADLQNDGQKNFTIQICALFDKIEVTYNRKDKIEIKANFVDLQMLKKYFLQMLNVNEKSVVEIAGLMELKNNLVSNLQEAIKLYDNTRKFSSNLPI